MPRAPDVEVEVVADEPAALTAEEESVIDAVRAEWLSTSLATGAADRRAAEDGVRRAYEAAGMPPPRTIVWLDSPLRATYAIAMLWLLRAYHDEPTQGDEVRQRLADDVGEPLWDEVWRELDP